MSVLRNPSGGTNHGDFLPISSALNNLPNGAGTIAAIFQKDAGTASFDICGLVNESVADWFHTLRKGTGVGDPDNALQDDDGSVMNSTTDAWTPVATDYYIGVVTWAAGTVTERFHRFDITSPAGWTHANASSANGGNRAGPGTGNGGWRIGYFGDGTSLGSIALCAAWVGIALTDAQCAELSVNSRTSDWWNNSGGQPTLLIECNTATPTDIGANPSTFSAIGGLTLTGADPTWTFDGRGVASFNPNEALQAHAGRFGPF